MNAQHPHRRLRHHIAVGVLCMAVLRLPAHASNIITDGTVGPAQSLSGPDFVIPQDLGARHGTNLFHSFQRFHIDRDQSATFTGSQDIQNVISRVTGGEASHIHGRLHSQIGQADFYFINPAGVMFGPEAVVDVPAGFHVSTAASLEFADGNSFHALHPERSTLTQAPPEAFGFMDAQAVAIHIDGSRFEFNPDSGVSLVSSGDIHITGTETSRARLHSPGGTLKLSAQGDIVLNRAEIDSSGDGGGRIDLAAGMATLTEVQLTAENQGSQDANGGIAARIAGLFQFNASGLYADVNDSGRGGVVLVQAGEVWLNDSFLTSDSYRGPTSDPNRPIGAAGGIELQVDGLLALMRGSQIRSACLC